MLLLVDIGNSNTKLKLSGESESFTIQTSENYFSSYYEIGVPEEMKREVDGAIISSVVPKANIPIIEFIKKVYGKVPLIVNTDMKTSIVFPKAVHNELGADLLCSMEGASTEGGSYLVVDCGTATTFNLVLDYHFIGLAIAPGMNTSHKALLKDAALLHYVDLNGPFQLLGLDTAQCVRSGSINGAAFIIDGFINAIKEQYKVKNLKVYITGGLSHILKDYVKSAIQYDKELLFKGMEHLFDMNKREK